MSVRRTACVSNMMSPARRWYARSFTASGVPAITMTGITTHVAAQTCESRILVRTETRSRGALVGAWAIADVGSAIRRGHRQTIGVTEAATPDLRRTSYAEPVEAGIPEPQAPPLPYRYNGRHKRRRNFRRRI